MHSKQQEIVLKSVIVVTVMAILFGLSVWSLQAPKQQTNLCQLFKRYPSWYWAAQTAQHTWGVPISTQMAFIHKESHFRASVKPPHQWLLGLLPWQRASSASGYTQALDDTWHAYLRARHKHSASRENFNNATDFLGWYINQLHHQTGIRKNDTYHLYLAYHEGSGGYLHHSYLAKPWLIGIAHNVNGQAQRYHHQLISCQQSLPQKPWWRFW